MSQLQKSQSANVMWRGGLFQTRAAASGKARSPTVDNCVRQTIGDDDDDAERRHPWIWRTSQTRQQCTMAPSHENISELVDGRSNEVWEVNRVHLFIFSLKSYSTYLQLLHTFLLLVDFVPRLAPSTSKFAHFSYQHPTMNTVYTVIIIVFATNSSVTWVLSRLICVAPRLWSQVTSNTSLCSQFTKAPYYDSKLKLGHKTVSPKTQRVANDSPMHSLA